MILQLCPGVCLTLPPGWRLLDRQADAVLLALDDPEEQVALRADLHAEVPLPPDGSFAGFIRPGDSADAWDGVWRPGEDQALWIAPEHRGRGPQLVLVDCLPVDLTGLCRLECAWPLTPALARDPERVAKLSQRSVEAVGRVFEQAQVTPTWPLPTAPAVPVGEQRVDASVALALPLGWTATRHPNGDGSADYCFADEADPYPCHLWLRTLKMALPEAPDLMRRAATWFRPGARETAAFRRPGLMPQFHLLSQDDAVVAWRNIKPEYDGITFATETGVRLRRSPGGVRLMKFSLAYPAEDCLKPSTYALAGQIWQALLTARFLG